AAAEAPAQTIGRRPAVQRTSEAAAPETAAAAPSAPADRDAARELFRLQTENQRLRARLDDVLNWLLENVRGTFPLPEDQMANLRIEPLDDALAVNPDLARLLRLTDEETARLGTAFAESREVLQELETENISVENPAEYQVVLSIPPYADTAEPVREALFGDLLRTLGRARYDRFLQVAGAGLEERFAHFGAEDRTLSFEAFADEASGAARLFVRDERALPDAADPDRVNVTASERVVATLPEEYEPYWAWLPDYVQAFSGAATGTD
ncbi:MAG: hypothetical protein IKQ15_06520, partial [Kiritimatiellae bacterium]|nr:hypothetical protein [Kiritimatiellia bacterium]